MSVVQSVIRPALGPVLILLLAFFVTVPFSAVHAQTSGTEKPVAGATPGGVNEGSSSDSELWRKIRQGRSGTVVGGDKSGGMMIQSGGQDWRLMRNGPLPRYAAWAILGTLLLLSLFFALRGRIKIGHGASGHTIKRFSAIERAGHWLLASSFIILALTGLNLIFGKTLLIPILGKDAFASITVFGKYIHNYVGFAFMLGLLMVAVMWVVHNIPNWHDVKWLLRGGGMVGGGHPPARKFNAGQKIIFWLVILCGISISMSGWALMNPFSTEMFSGTFSLSNSIFGTSYATDLAPIQEQQYQSLWHTIMAVFMIVIILAHIYIGSVGMEGALSAMTTGEVDTNWAREHHLLWVEEEEAKRGAPFSPANISLAATAGVSVVPDAVSRAPTGPRVESSGTVAPLPRRAEPAKQKVAPKVSAKQDAKVTPQPKKAKPVSKSKPAGKPKVASKSVMTSKSKTTAKAAVAAKSKAKAKVAAKPKAAPKSRPKPVVKAKAASRAKVAPAKTSSRTMAKTTPKPKASKAASKRKSSVKDDLKLIKGVGPQNERRLNAIGVKRFDDVAKWTKKEQADIGQRLAFPGRIEREEWVKQAKALAKKAIKG